MSSIEMEARRLVTMMFSDLRLRTETGKSGTGDVVGTSLALSGSWMGWWWSGKAQECERPKTNLKIEIFDLKFIFDFFYIKLFIKLL